MDVNIHGRNIRITDSLEAYARRKLDRLDRYLPNIAHVRIDLSSEHTRRGENMVTAQITIKHERGAILRAEEKLLGDIQIAIDSAVNKMYRQIQRFKGKRSRKGSTRFAATLEELDVAEEIPNVEQYVEEEIPIEIPTEEVPIIRRKDFAVATMSESEAIEQMELLGHAFFVFFNADTNSVNVLYRRTSGGYGVLVPKAE
jgi:putative sigma-54 modulation protein